MLIKVNGRDADLQAGMNLDQLLAFYKLKKEQVVVELNQIVPSKSSYGQTFLQAGDAVEIVKFMGGG